MRVVGGSARGRRLAAPPGDRTRPTSDRVREAIFNALWSRGALAETTVVDLFAGSGAMGVEALSRGAAHVTFVDQSAAARRAVEHNLRVCGFTDRADVVGVAAERFLERGAAEGVRFDLAFCDPPYAYARWPDLLTVLRADLAVLEADEAVAVPEPWDLVRSRRYGSTWVGFAELRR